MATISAVVIGASGLVGSHIYRELKKQGVDTVGTYRTCPSAEYPDLVRSDVCDPHDPVFEASKMADFVFLCAARTNVDDCEINPALSYAFNVLPTRLLLAKTRAKVVLLSSLYAADPVNMYGKHKREAEEVAALNRDSLVVRTHWVFGKEQQRKNFVYQVRDSNAHLNVPSDQTGQPTYAKDLASCLVTCAMEGLCGTVNAVGSDILTKHQWGIRTALALKLPIDHLQPIATDDMKRPAPRPLNCVSKNSIIGPRAIDDALIEMAGDM